MQINLEDTIKFSILRNYEYNLDEPVLDYLKLFGMPLKIEYTRDKEFYGCNLVYGHHVKKHIEEVEKANQCLIEENKKLKQELMEVRRQLHQQDLKLRNIE